MPTEFPTQSNFSTPFGGSGAGAANTGVTSAHSGLRVWQVAALVRALSDALDARFNPVAVSGEITGWQRAASGHCYFTLKDSSRAGLGGGAAIEGAIGCAMFKRAANLLDFEPRNGDVVELRGRLGVYEARGSLQIVAESMHKSVPKAQTLWEQFERLKAKLQAEGLFDAGRKRALPHFVRGVAVVTSLQAAALQDVLTALARRLPHATVWVFPAAVQGAGAPGEIVSALKKIEKTMTQSPAPIRVDAVLLVRGGGAMEDLWAFNDEALVRAIVASPLPVVCGVGHESDFTLADFAADLRAPTPTAAAELVSEPTSVWLRTLDLLQDRLADAARRRLDRQAQRLDTLAARVARPAASVQAARVQQLRFLARLRSAMLLKMQQQSTVFIGQSANLDQKIRQNLLQHAQKLDSLALRLDAVNHTRVVQRGYALMTNVQGIALTSAAQFEPGQAVVATLADGSVALTVKAACKSE